MPDPIIAEKNYWYYVIYQYLVHDNDIRWVNPSEAVRAFIEGTANQEYRDEAMEWPILRWHQLNKLSDQGDMWPEQKA